MSSENARNPTQVEHTSMRRETKYQPAGDVPVSTDRVVSAVRPDPEDNRRIVGILATYRWRKEGQIFHVREGRTHIGAGRIKEDSMHRLVEVCCEADTLLSEDHAEILVQAKKFWIRDLSSTNGTFLNGEQLRPETAEELPNNSIIKAGATEFIFLKIEPISAVHTETAARPDSRTRVSEAGR